MENLSALVLDGTGGGRALDREALRRWTPADGPLWVRLHPRGDEGQRWLAEESGLPAGDQQTLLRPVRQTRIATVEGGELMVALRSFALETEDLRQARILLRADRLVTVTGDSFPALDECVTRLERGHGPKTVTDIALLAFRVGVERDQVAAYKLDEDVAELEYSGERNIAHSLDTLREVRLRATGLRRRLGAGREALVELKQLGPPWLVGEHADLWRDVLAGSDGLVEIVDAVLERIRGLQELTQNKLSTALNDRLYLLTVISAIMMPLSFVTGLLGVNVGGVPARQTPWAFAALCALLVLVAIGEYLLLRRLRWVPGAATGPYALGRRGRAGVAMAAELRASHLP